MENSILTHESFILATYPFVIFGSLCALIMCFIAVIRTKKHHLPIWWLFVGICFNMLAITIENSWWAVARLIDWDGMSHNAYIIVPTKIVAATGAWLHFFGALSVLIGLTFGQVRRALIFGVCLFMPSYFLMVWIFGG